MTSDGYAKQRISVILRPLLDQDAERLVPWLHEWASPSDPQSFRDEVAASELDEVRGVDADGELVGLVALQCRTMDSASLALVIAPEARGRGLGQAAVLAALGLARELGLGRVWLEVSSANPAAIRVYEACGFGLEAETAGVRRYSRGL